MVCYSHLLKNFPQFVVIDTVKGFGVVKKAEIDVFLELSCFFDDPMDVGNLISGSSAFSKSSLNIWKVTVHVLLKPGLENLQPSRTNTQKIFPFHYRALECKSRKSRDTWSDRKFGLQVTKQSRSKANRVLPRERTGHSKHPLPAKTTRGHHQMVNTEINLCNQRWRSSIQSSKTRPGADCGSDHELLIAKFRLKLKKVGKTTRAFRCDLSQIPYTYIVEVTNRFRGFDPIDRVPEELWTEVRDICTGGRDQDHPQEKEMQKGKTVSEEALQIAEKRREAKDKGEKERHTHLKAEFQGIARRDKKAILTDLEAPTFEVVLCPVQSPP